MRLYNGASTIRGCVNYATITATSYVGGILGKQYLATGLNMNVELCVNYGSIIGTLDAASVQTYIFLPQNIEMISYLW